MNEKIVTILKPGMGFGERGVLYKLPRALSARIKGNGGLLKVIRKDFKKVIAPQME